MPTIQQLPAAGSLSPTDELPVAQGDTTRGLTLATLLGNLQPLIVLNGDALLGRTTAGPGGVELITAGAGLALASGVLSATGAEQSGFAMQPVLSLADQVVLCSGGQQRRMALPLLRGLFAAGSRIAIDVTGVISSAAPVFLIGTGAPSAAVGVDNDSYLDIATGNIWTHAAGIWANNGGNLLAPEATARAAALAPLVILRGSSVGAIPLQLTTDGTPSSASETLVLPAQRSVMRLTGSVTAQDLASGDAIIWDVAAAVKRSGAGVAPQLLGSASISVFASDATMTGCQLGFGANARGGAFAGIGLNGYAINWSAALSVVSGT
jgi:hypothetical protein